MDAIDFENLDFKNGDLRVWHIPQLPMDAFYVLVKSPEEAIKILEVLAHYDLFEFENNVKPDYSNAAGLEVYEDGEWIEWYDDETGEDIDGYAEMLKEEKKRRIVVDSKSTIQVIP